MTRSICFIVLVRPCDPFVFFLFCFCFFFFFLLFFFLCLFFFFFSSRRRHTRCSRDWSSDVCSSDLLSKIPMLLMEPEGSIIYYYYKLPAAISPGFLSLIGMKINSTAFIGSIAISTYNSLRAIRVGVLFESSQTTK